MSNELDDSFITHLKQRVPLILACMGMLSMSGCSVPKPTVDASSAIRSLHARHYQQAIKEFTVLLDACPDSVRWRQLRGFAFDELGQYEAGIADYSIVLNRLPTDVRCLSNRGYALYQINRLGEAVTDYDRALELDPTFLPARSNRALVLVALARYPQALADIERAIAEGDTANSTLYNLQGYCLLQLNRPAFAICAFDKAIALDAGYADAVSNRVAAYQLLARNGKRIL